MAWPTYAKFEIDTIEDFDPSVERVEMERGIAKQRIINSDVMVELRGTVVFTKKTDIAAFETWYFNTIGRVGWFDFTHPRTKVTVQARIQGGVLGPLVPIRRGFGCASRQLTLEYLR